MGGRGRHPSLPAASAEHDDLARAKICHHMDWLGIRIDSEKNKDIRGDVCEITGLGRKGAHPGHRYR